MLLSRSAFCQVIVTGLGLSAILLHVSTFFPPRDRWELVAVLAVGLFLVTAVLLTGRTFIRWLIGQFSFTTACALSLYVLFPLIIWALLLEDQTSRPELALQSFNPTSHPGFLLLGALLLPCGVLWLLHKATLEQGRLIGVVDYWREHPEGQRWSGGWRQVLLAVLLLIAFCIGAGLFVLAFYHSLLWLVACVPIEAPVPRSIAFERASTLMAGLVNHYSNHAGIPVNGWKFASGLLLIYASPVLLWGGAHIHAFFHDLIKHARLWFLDGVPPNSEVRQIVVNVAKFAGIRPPAVRLDPSETVQAYAPISPLPLMPRMVVLSSGALKHLQRNGLAALLAHEIGHLHRGHTSTYTWLRLVSRIFFLGPSFLTCLIKTPVKLEAEADAFAVKWLESGYGTRQDLADALRLMERRNVSSLLTQGLREGVVLAGGPGADWLPLSLRQAVQSNKSRSFVLNIVTRWRLLHYLSLHSDLATYTYASLSERLNMISNLPRNPMPNENRIDTAK